jgi:hypothetical protein
VRLPGSPDSLSTNLQAHSAPRTSSPVATSAARSFAMAIPVLSVPFALLYYVKHGGQWFDSDIERLLLLVAIEHAVVFGHWIAGSLADVVDKWRIDAAEAAESQFERELKMAAAKKKEELEQEMKVQAAVMNEKEKWSKELDNARVTSENLTRQEESTKAELMDELTIANSRLRAHWFQPMSMRTNLQLTIYWAVEQHLLTKRFEQTQSLLATPVCEENEIYLSRYYLPKRKVSLSSRYFHVSRRMR